MNFSIPYLSLQHSKMVVVVFALLLTIGGFSLVSMPKSENPMINIPGFIIAVIYPGASIDEIEQQIVVPLEETLNSLEEVENINTTIGNGIAMTTIEFQFDSEAEIKYREVQSQVASIRKRWPSGVYSVDIIKPDISEIPIFQLALTSDIADYEALYYESEKIKKAVEQSQLVKRVDINALADKEVQIQLDPVQISAYGFGLEEISKAIQSNNLHIPGGDLLIGDKQLTLIASTAYNDLEEIKSTIVGVFRNQHIYLKDIAEVSMGYERNRYKARYNGIPASVLTIIAKKKVNILDAAEEVKNKLSSLKLSSGVKLNTVVDQPQMVKSRINDLGANILQGILLVGLVIFLAVDINSALIVMLTIPLSILIGITLVDWSGIHLQQITIAGVIVALGLLVDNAIVVIENIKRLRTRGEPLQAAIIKGTNQLIRPVSSATITTILAFLPIILLPGRIGAFIKALPLTVSSIMLVSLAISFTLIPVLIKRVLSNSRQPLLLASLQNFINGPYDRWIDRFFKHRKTIGLLVLLITMTSGYLFVIVGKSFFPKAEKPFFTIQIQMPEESRLEVTEKMVDRIEAILADETDIQLYASNIGQGNPRVYYNAFPHTTASNFAEIFVSFNQYDPKQITSLIERLKQRFSTINEARIEVNEFVQGPRAVPPVVVKVFGTDLDQLEQYAVRVERILQENGKVFNVKNNFNHKKTNARLLIDKDKSLLLGVPELKIVQMVRTCLNGDHIGTLYDKKGRAYPMKMSIKTEEDNFKGELGLLNIRTNLNKLIPLKQFVDFELFNEQSAVHHENLQRTAMITADLREGEVIDEVVEEIQVAMEQFNWEAGASYEFWGTFRDMQQSFYDLKVASLIAMLLIFGVLIFQFNSFIQPLIVYLSLPFTLLGAIGILILSNTSFSFTAFVGLISLIGIAVNNAIILVDYANRLHQEGWSREAAAKKAGQVRFIPITLTTLTTVLGLLPLTLSGSMIWMPLGLTIIGGLLSSAILVLLFTPVIYVGLTNLSLTFLSNDDE